MADRNGSAGLAHVGRHRRIAVVMLVLCVTIAACGGDEATLDRSETSSTEYLADLTRARGEGLTVQYWPEDARDFVEASGERKEPFADVVVTGRVVSFEMGAAFVENEPGGAASVEVPFDDQDAQWRTIELEFEVDDVLHGRVDTDSIVVGFSSGAGTDPEAIAQGFMDLGTLALPLFAGSAVFDYEPGIWAIVGDGLYVMTVSPSGTLGMPLADPTMAAALLERTSTVKGLRTNPS